MFGGNRGSSASGDIPPRPYSPEVIVNPQDYFDEIVEIDLVAPPIEEPKPRTIPRPPVVVVAPPVEARGWWERLLRVLRGDRLREQRCQE